MMTNISNFRTTRLPRVRFNKGFRIRQINYGFHTLSPFSYWGTKTVFDPKAMEEKGLEESTYPKPALTELSF